jgi:hypothetical protein
MEIKPDGDDGSAERLAPWIREMGLADQVFIAGATLVLEEIRLRRDDLPIQYDEAGLREGTPDEVYGRAVYLAQSYSTQSPQYGEDGIDEHWRISNMAHELATRVAKYHPEVLGGDQ